MATGVGDASAVGRVGFESVVDVDEEAEFLLVFVGEFVGEGCEVLFEDGDVDADGAFGVAAAGFAPVEVGAVAGVGGDEGEDGLIVDHFLVQFGAPRM